MKTTSHASNLGLILFLIGLYLAFVVWMYVSEPLLLAVFGAALAIIWLRDTMPRAFARVFALLQTQARRSTESSPSS